MLPFASFCSAARDYETRVVIQQPNPLIYPTPGTKF